MTRSAPGRLLAAALLVAAATATPAAAQTDAERRIDRLEREIRELRAILFQGRDTGQPVVVKPAGPDPAVEALRGRTDQIEETSRGLAGRVEVLGHDLDELRRTVQADHDALVELRGEMKGLTDQIARTLPPPAAALPAAPPPGAPPQVAEPPAAGDEGAAFRAARQRLEDGDYPAAAGALQAYISAYAASPRAREAYFLLGEADYGQSMYAEATVAYARALKDWPKSAWAPEAVIKLARALQSSGRADQACAALGEFRRRYGALATKAQKAQAAAAGATAKCSAE